MKKLFLLIPALVLALVTNATVTNVTPSSYEGVDVLRKALYYSAEGDTIVMASGTYEESNSDYIAWRRSNVVMAAEGANVTIKPHVSFRVRNGARAVLIGVKIDASELTSLANYEDIFQAGDANDGNRLILENCEIYGNVAKTMVYCASDKKLDSLIINNCYIHDNAQATLRLLSTSLKGVTITNTTIANVVNGGSFWCAPIYIKNSDADAKVIVDHCTFYHNTSISSNYADVTVGYDGSATSDVTITNCIFAQPGSYSGSRAINLVNGGTVRNCLTFNYTKSTDGIQGETVREKCIAVDPLFIDAANGDYSFPGNWVTMQLSPARGAATDGSDLGDPRWYSDEVLPESNFVSPYAFVGEKALLAGNIWYNSDDAYLYYNDKSECGTATWKIHATRNGAMKVTLNMNAGTTTGHKFKVELFDANGNLIDETAEPSQKADAGDIDLEKTLVIPAIGDYIVKLSNLTGWSSAKINSVTLAYMGGAMQNIPCTILPEEALRSSLAFVNEDGELRFTDDDHTGYILDQWAKWNIHVAKEGNYKFATHVNSANGHSYTVNIYNNDETVLKGTASMPEAGNWGHERTFYSDNIYLEEGNYIIKVQNNTNYSYGRVIDIVATYERGARKNVPGQILGEDAMICKEEAATHDVKMYHLENGDLQYNDNGHNLEEYALWNIHADAACELSVTLNIAHSGHIFTVELYDGENLIGSAAETDATKWDGGNIDLADHLNIPAAGNYTVKLINNQQFSGGALHGITFTEIVPPTFVEIDETADAPSWTVSDDLVNVRLLRTFKGDMYNTICLPFAVSSSKLVAAFGEGVELLYMNSATLNGNELDLIFAATSSIYQGTPFLIKPVADVVNPQFMDVQIVLNGNQPDATSGTNADFIGNFIKSEVPAGENNLFLGPDNLLYFSQTATPIKGMRAYFQVKGVPNPMQAIKHARIVMNGQVATEINLVNAEQADSQKRIENGQLIIIRDGVRYNVMGTVIK